MVSARTTQLGPGLHFDEWKVRGTCRIAAGASKGDLVMFDTLLTDGAVNDNSPGQADSGLVNFILPTTAQLPDGFFAVVLEDCVDDEEGVPLAIAGRVRMSFTGATDILLGGANGSPTAVIAAGTTKVIAKSLEAGAGAGDPKWVVFDGVNGVGGTV